MRKLASEDELRLNVLLANQPRVIRIDERSLTVDARGDQGNYSVSLHPNCRDDDYLRLVRDQLSENALGFTGGFPAFATRWRRMNQTPASLIDTLLLLGEPEAITAVVHAERLTPDQARLAWWALPETAIARQLLSHPEVAACDLGPELAGHLLEYLPFETASEQQVESVIRMLQPGLITSDQRSVLWNKGQQNSSILLGFLLATPDDLPETSPERNDLGDYKEELSGLTHAGNRQAELLLQTFSAPGQGFLRACRRVLEKPADQFVINTLLDSIAEYFSSIRPDSVEDATLDVIQQRVHRAINESSPGSHSGQITGPFPQLLPELAAMMTLSQIGYSVLRPVLANSSATGALMRRKLRTTIDALQSEIDVLIGANSYNKAR